MISKKLFLIFAKTFIQDFLQLLWYVFKIGIKSFFQNTTTFVATERGLTFCDNHKDCNGIFTFNAIFQSVQEIKKYHKFQIKKFRTTNSLIKNIFIFYKKLSEISDNSKSLVFSSDCSFLVDKVMATNQNIFGSKNFIDSNDRFLQIIALLQNFKSFLILNLKFQIKSEKRLLSNDFLIDCLNGCFIHFALKEKTFSCINIK